MRAVNLIPGDARNDARSARRGSAHDVYLLLAGLGALVVCATLWATANKQVGDRRATLERVTAQAAAAEKRAAASEPFVAFKQLASTRVQTVKTLSQTRFDWAHAMREVGRVLPSDVWLMSMSGASGASGGSPTPATSAAPAPTITLTGCTRSQAKVALLMARLRTIDGVRKISLKSSDKPDAKGDPGCPANRESDPRFVIAVAFAVPGALRDGVDDTGQVTSGPVAAPSAAVAGAHDAQAAAALSVVRQEG